MVFLLGFAGTVRALSGGSLLFYGALVHILSLSALHPQSKRLAG